MNDASKFDWGDIKLFLAIVKEGSFGKAAETLGLTQSTVSRRVDQLEERFEKKLFNRSASGAELTQAGQEMAVVAEKMAAGAEALERLSKKSSAAATGKVFIRVPDVIAQCIIVPHLHELLDAHPALSIVFDSDILNLDDSAPDIWLQFMDPKDQSLLRAPVGFVHYTSFASAEYLEEHGAPASMAEAASRRIIHNSSYYAHRQNWSKKVDAINVLNEDELILVTDSGPLNIQLVLAGVGIAALPSVACELHGLIPMNLGCGGTARLNMYYAKNSDDRNEVAVCKEWLMGILSSNRWLQEEFLDPYEIVNS